MLSSLLLSGIAINALCGAAVGILSYFSNDQQLRQFSLWMMGSLSQVKWPMLGLAAAFIIPTMVITLLQVHKLNLLQLSDEEAHYLGINIQQTKSRFLLLSTLLVSTAVALSGIIGFIGLVIPHLIRMHLGADHRWLLPGAALGGACLLLSANTLARTLVAPSEMPVGLITSLIGGPYFLWLILRQQEPLVDNSLSPNLLENRFLDNPALIQAQHLYYRVGKCNLIKNVSLHINSGEIVAIIGPNGAGNLSCCVY